MTARVKRVTAIRATYFHNLKSEELIGCNKTSKNDPEFKRTGKVIIGENAFVGANSIILPIVVGKNAIVGAGSVVTKDVPENTIVAGNPTRNIEMIQENIDKTVLK